MNQIEDFNELSNKCYAIVGHDMFSKIEKN